MGATTKSRYRSSVARWEPQHDYRRMDRPETRFAWNGDVSLAYQVCGGGPTDLVYLQGYCSNADGKVPISPVFYVGWPARRA